MAYDVKTYERPRAARSAISAGWTRASANKAEAQNKRAQIAQVQTNQTAHWTV